MRIEPELSGVQIVVLGKFNPAIFAPAWFALNGLLRESVTANAQVQVIHPQVADFTADWLHLKVTSERFEVTTQQAPYERLRDLVVRVLSECLYHTPVTAFGINRNVHFLVRDAGVRDVIGTALAPLEPWGQWREQLKLDGAHGGMTGVRMSQLKPSGRHEGGQINVTVEPSVRVGEQRRGVFVGVNDHFVADQQGEHSAKRLMEVLAGEFSRSIDRSDGIIDHIMSLADPGDLIQ